MDVPSDPSRRTFGGREIEVSGKQLGYPFRTTAFTGADGTWFVPNLDQGTQVTACVLIKSQDQSSRAETKTQRLVGVPR